MSDTDDTDKTIQQPAPGTTSELPAQPTPPPAPAHESAPTAGPATQKVAFKDRSWSTRTLVAAALAAVLVGGAGAAIGTAPGGSDSDGRGGPGGQWAHFRGPVPGGSHGGFGQGDPRQDDPRQDDPRQEGSGQDGSGRDRQQPDTDGGSAAQSSASAI
ncbi:MAG: hypothetical protein JWR27_262 [Aeromicrobium sp.]|nr:hypothetical protein [Aeromicrobium sp.]